MSIFNKLLSAIRVNDDFDEEDDEFLDDEDELEEDDLDDVDDDDEEFEEKPKRRFFRKMKDDLEDEDEDEDEDDEDEDDEPVKPARLPRFGAKEKAPAAEPAKEKEPFSLTRTKTSPSNNRFTATSSKVTPMRKKGSSLNNMEVVVIKPASMEDTREIADSLGADHTVILNLEGVDVDVAQRIIDFCCGSTYMIQGSLQKVSSYIFILTPSGVEISGDYQDILSSAFDLPSMRMDY